MMQLDNSKCKLQKKKTDRTWAEAAKIVSDVVACHKYPEFCDAQKKINTCKPQNVEKTNSC